MQVNREKILEQAIYDCYKEMYAKAQPSADFDQIVEDFKSGKRDKDERVYEQHFLSREEYDFIMNKYRDAYNISQHWKSDADVFRQYFVEGGYKDHYVPARVDENGMKHPGYRSSKKVEPIGDQIRELISDPELADKVVTCVLDNLENCASFYKFDREYDSFNCTIALGVSPTSNAEVVKEYWKSKGIDLEIVQRNPKLFYYEDNDWSEDEMAFEFEDYGENWREALQKEWDEELAKREAERKHKIEEMSKQMKKNKK